MVEEASSGIKAATEDPLAVRVNIDISVFLI